MKNIINILLLGISFLFSAAMFPASDPDSICLQIDARVLNAGLQGAGGCTIELTCENSMVKKRVLTNSRKKFRCQLLRNKIYTLKISQDGFIDKLIHIDTAIPGSNFDTFGFSFETSLLQAKDLCRFNQDVLAMPVARIFFDTKRNCFYYDKDYSETIKKEMLISYQGEDPCGKSRQTIK